MNIGGLVLLVTGVVLVYLGATGKLVPVWHLLQDGWQDVPPGTTAKSAGGGGK